MAEKAETDHIRVGDVRTITGTVRTVSSIVPHGHLRVTLDFDEKAAREMCAGSHDGHPCGVCDGPEPKGETVALALRPWECHSNSVPDLALACRRRIWLPWSWWGHCRRCAAAADSRGAV